MYIVFIRGSGQMGKRFDDPKEMGEWIAKNIKKDQEIIVKLYI